MAHKIEIRLWDFSEDDHHKVRNFVEDVWREIELRGWAEWENFDHRINPGARFHFSFPSRQSHDAVSLIDRLIRKHFMDRLATFEHMKSARANG